MKPKNPLKLSSHFKRNQKTATQAHLLRVKIVVKYDFVKDVLVFYEKGVREKFQVLLNDD